MSGMFSSLFGGGGTAKRAANVVAEGQRQAGELVNQRYQDVSQNYQPYMDAGTGALTNYQNIAGGLQGQFNPILGQMGETVGKLSSNNLNDYQQSPGYEWRMQQGQKALENSAAAKGTLFSGATGKALTEYGQNFGSNEYQNYLGNLQNQLSAQGNYLGSSINAANAELNPYGTLMNQGYNAANTQGQLGMNAANTQAGYITGANNAVAQGMIAKDQQMQNAGNQWIQLGSMAAGAAMGGAGALGGAGGMTGAMQGMQMGGQLGGTLTGQQPTFSQQPYQSFQPQVQQQSQPTQQYQQQAYQTPTAQYQGTNYYNPTQGNQSSWQAR